MFPEKKPFFDHLEDFRQTFIRILVTVGITTVLSFFLSPKIFSMLKFPLERALTSIGKVGMEKEILRSMAPGGAFSLSLKIALCSGLIVSSPISLFFLAQFILPGLLEKERRYLYPVLFWGGILFLLGVLLCYQIVLPQSLKFLWRFHDFMGIVPLWTVDHYISFTLFLMLSFGLSFETPLLILALVKLNILSSKTLREKRRHAIVAIFIIAAVLTPSPDAFSQVLLALPMILLYEGCIWVSRKLD